MVNFGNKLIIKVIIITFIMLFVTKQGIFFKFFNKMFLYFNNRYNVLEITQKECIIENIFFYIIGIFMYMCMYFFH